MRVFYKLLIIVLLAVLSTLIFIIETTVDPLLIEFRTCYKDNVLIYGNDFKSLWNNIASSAEKCEFSKNLDIRPIDNKDETKWIVNPKLNETLTMVTLGIGMDIGAERVLKNMLPNIEFYGADPSHENKELYELIGKYFPVAVTGETGYRSSRVLADKLYRESSTMNIDFIYFITEVIKKKRIDILWIDVEGGEFEIMELLSSKRISRINICQINMEIHVNIMDGIKNEKQMFESFIRKIVEDGKYIIVKPFYETIHGYIRIFMINFSDPECRRIYF